MRYNKEDLIRSIWQVLDLGEENTSLFGGIDGIATNMLIEQSLLSALHWLYLNAPIHKLGGGKSFARGSISWDSGLIGIGSGRILLPDDFVRLQVFEMSDWTKPIYQALEAGHPLQTLQTSPFVGIKGSPERPVAFLEHEAIGKVLHFHSCLAGAQVYVKQALYIPLPEKNFQELELSIELHYALVYHSSSLVAISLGNQELATQAHNIAKSFIQ